MSDWALVVAIYLIGVLFMTLWLFAMEKDKPREHVFPLEDLREWVRNNAGELNSLLSPMKMNEVCAALREITGEQVMQSDRIGLTAHRFLARLQEMKEDGTLQQAIDDYKERRQP